MQSLRVIRHLPPPPDPGPRTPAHSLTSLKCTCANKAMDFTYPALSQPVLVYELQTSLNQPVALSQPDNPPPSLPSKSLTDIQSLTKLAEGLKSGQGEIKFVEPFKEIQTECPICLQVLREPYMVECCGYRFCQPCVNRIKKAGSKCPLCNQFFSMSIPDKQLRRILNERKIFCVLQSHGCSWQGQMNSIQNHINISNGSLPSNGSCCQYVPVPCKFCNVLYIRIDMETHEDECPLKPVHCEHCRNYTAPYHDVINHHDECPCYPTLCPNKCSDFKFKREDVEMHLSVTCLLQDIPCEFSYTGCNIVKNRKDMPDHLKENMELHLQLLSDKHQDLEIRCHELEDQNQQLKQYMNLCALLQIENEVTKKELKKFKDGNLKGSEKVGCILVTNISSDASNNDLRSVFGMTGTVSELKYWPEQHAAAVFYSNPHHYTATIQRSQDHGINLLLHQLKLTPINVEE